MPFYLRKSVSAGPFRFNFSKSGIGLSVGVKGLRFGTGPRGHYVHAGRGGLYYRSTIPSSDRRRSPPGEQTPRQPSSSPSGYADPNIEMVAVSSGAVSEMEDSRFADVLADMNEKQNATSMSTVLLWAGVIVGVLGMVFTGISGSIVGIVMAFGGWGVGKWLDESQRSVVLMYDLEEDARVTYEEMTTAFDRIAGCKGRWHVDAGGAVRDLHTWKRNAGASHVLDKRPTELGYGLPPVVKSNVTPPQVQVGKETLYFLPDFLLVVHAHQIGAVAYDQLDISWQDSNFIEDGSVPSDTQIISYTWKHPNKSGGPDRRFRDNYQIPVCLYESIHLSSANGLNELLQVSQNGVTAPFAHAIDDLAKANGSRTGQVDLPQITAG